MIQQKSSFALKIRHKFFYRRGRCQLTLEKESRRSYELNWASSDRCAIIFVFNIVTCRVLVDLLLWRNREELDREIGKSRRGLYRILYIHILETWTQENHLENSEELVQCYVRCMLANWLTLLPLFIIFLIYLQLCVYLFVINGRQFENLFFSRLASLYVRHLRILNKTLFVSLYLT